MMTLYIMHYTLDDIGQGLHKSNRGHLNNIEIEMVNMWSNKG